MMVLFAFVGDLTTLLHEKKMARELPLLRPPSHRRLCVLKSQRVLADLCNHTGLEVSFHRVETCKSMSHRVFSSFIQVEFRNLPRGDLLIA